MVFFSCTQTDADWLNEFLALDGLGLLFHALSRCSQRSLSLDTALLQLEVVGCLRAVMNNRVGLDHIIDSGTYSRQLADGSTRI